MKALLFFSLICVVTTAGPAGTIIQIPLRVPMTNEKEPSRDFYVDLGTRQGIKEGDTLEVSRQFPVLYSMSGQPWQLIQLVLGEATVIATGESVSLVRTKRLVDASKLPATNYRQFMVGDVVSNLRAQN